MRIRLSSNFVSFESGSAALMPWGPPFPDAVELCPLLNNEIDVKMDRAGLHLLILADFTVRRISDGAVHSIGAFTATANVTEEDLVRAGMTVAIDASQILRVTALDEFSRPCADQHVMLPVSPDGFGNIQGDQLRFLSKSVKTDKQGTFLLLGNLSITWPDQDPVLTLSIQPV
jgi:hypothetical protein